MNSHQVFVLSISFVLVLICVDCTVYRGNLCLDCKCYPDDESAQEIICVGTESSQNLSLLTSVYLPLDPIKRIEVKNYTNVAVSLDFFDKIEVMVFDTIDYLHIGGIFLLQQTIMIFKNTFIPRIPKHMIQYNSDMQQLQITNVHIGLIETEALSGAELESVAWENVIVDEMEENAIYWRSMPLSSTLSFVNCTFNHLKNKSIDVSFGSVKMEFNRFQQIDLPQDTITIMATNLSFAHNTFDGLLSSPAISIECRNTTISNNTFLLNPPHAALRSINAGENATFVGNKYNCSSCVVSPSSIRGLPRRFVEENTCLQLQNCSVQNTYRGSTCVNNTVTDFECGSPPTTTASTHRTSDAAPADSSAVRHNIDLLLALCLVLNILQ